MTQLHKRFTDDQIKVLLSGYCQGLLARAEIQEMLDIGKTRFFTLLKEYRKDPEAFSVAYERHTPSKLPAGALVQHDSSLHLWSPFAQEKWVLITSSDDFSQMLLFADFAPKDTTWAHIQAAQAFMQSYGIPLRYYVDSLRVFRFVQGRDSIWRKHVLQTDDVDTQSLTHCPELAIIWRQLCWSNSVTTANAFHRLPMCRPCLANRWLAIAWKLWQTRQAYDEAYHLRRCALRSKPRR
ncbi:MAG: hypothetical protein ACE5OS_11815 [Anaerolineae bacterium]